jgi:hypothetical protein
MLERIIVAPSILATDFGHLAAEIRADDAAGADWMAASSRTGNRRSGAGLYAKAAQCAPDDRGARALSRGLRRGRSRSSPHPRGAVVDDRPPRGPLSNPTCSRFVEVGVKFKCEARMS